MPEAVISFDLERQKRFNAGQMYVAMSRVKYLNGLYFTGNYNYKAIIADKKAFAEYERMRRECILPSPDSLGKLTPNSLCICLLNTRSLRLHVKDILCNYELMESDILCLTKTQLLPTQGTQDICLELHEFQLSFNSNEDKFCSIACGAKPPSLIVSHDKYPGFSLIKLSKHSFLDCAICIGILYRKHSNPIGVFYDDLRVLVHNYNIDILLGDFNIDYFDKQDSPL